jgi:hypothetical protein
MKITQLLDFSILKNSSNWFEIHSIFYFITDKKNYQYSS